MKAYEGLVAVLGYLLRIFRNVDGCGHRAVWHFATRLSSALRAPLYAAAQSTALCPCVFGIPLCANNPFTRRPHGATPG
jgi:hypothetical protein